MLRAAEHAVVIGIRVAGMVAARVLSVEGSGMLATSEDIRGSGALGTRPSLPTRLMHGDVDPIVYVDSAVWTGARQKMIDAREP